MAVDLTKVNYILLKSDGSVLAQNLDYYVQQGSTGVDKIFFGSLATVNTDIGQAICTLPNGEQNTLIGSWDTCTYKIEGVDTTVGGFLFTLTTDQTNYPGGLTMSLAIYRSSVRLVNYPLYLVINETGLQSDTNTGVTVEEINSYLQQIQQLLRVDNSILVVDNMSYAVASDKAVGQIFLNKNNGLFYIKNSADYPFYTQWTGIGYVPYTGAVSDLDLGGHDFKATNIELKSFLDIKDSTGVYGASLYIDGNHDFHIILANTSDGQTGEIVFPATIDGTATTKEYVDARVDKIISLASISGNMSADDYNLPNVRILYNNYYYEKAFISGGIIYFLRLKAANLVSGDTTYLYQHAITVDTNNSGAIAQNNSSFAIVYSASQTDTKFYNKTEADSLLATKVDKTSSTKKLYGTDSSGNQTTLDYGANTLSNGIVQRNSSGHIKVPIEPSDIASATSRGYVDTKISQVLSDAYQVVNTTTYPTLNDFLASTGQDGIIYLYPIDTNDLTKGYYRYIWESNAWLDLGTTQIDLSDYYTKSQTNALLDGKVDKTSNSRAIYGTDDYGAQSLYSVGVNQISYGISQRDANGQLYVLATPTNEYHATSKSYVDGLIATCVVDNDLNVSGDYISQIKKGNAWYPIAQSVSVYTTPKVVQTTSDLPEDNDGYLYLVVADGYIYYWDADTEAWVQGYEYAQDLSNFVQTSRTIAGIDLSANISAQDLTDALVLASNSDIDALF